MPDDVMLIGEGFVGEGAEAAHVSTVLGRRDRPVSAPGIADVPAARDHPVNPYFDLAALAAPGA